MNIKLSLLAALLLTTLGGCAEKAVNNRPAPKPAANSSATPVPTASVPKNGDYDGKGVVTKIDLNIGSVEMDHEEIKDVMPPMRMEFYVSDKKMLDGIKVGDRVDFVLRYKDHTETVVNIRKAQ